MYSDIANKEVIDRGKKKVYAAIEKLELTLPNGESDGILEKGDLIYVSEKYKIGGKSAFRFRVIKFAESAKESKVYSAEREHFKPYYESKSNAEGDKVDSAIADKGVKEANDPNYIVPAITSIAGGIVGYLFAEKYMKNKIVYGLGGVAIGLAFGMFILKNKEKN